MTAGRFDSTKASLQGLLRDIQEGKIQLPDFQRGWVWDDEHIRSLIASLSLSFPIGAIMLLETGNPNVRFKPRPVEGVRLASPPSPEKLILDGQQRLTSLYQALVMDEPVTTKDAKKNDIVRWYYIDLTTALNPNADREEAVFAVPADRVVKNFRGEVLLDLSTPEKECAAEALPVNLLYDIAGLNRWQMIYLQQDGDQMAERLQRWNQVIEQIVQPYQQYQVPLIQLGKETSKEAVCKVFEKVNTGGVSLTVFELLTATYAAEDYNLRTDWEARKRKLHRLKALSKTDSDAFLQSVSLLTTLNRKRQNPDAAVGCKRRDILALELEDYQRWADAATEGYERAARFLYDQKIFGARDVPYLTQLIPLSAILAELGTKAEKEGTMAKVRRWFWCGVLGELYGGAIETRFAKDVPQVLEWIDGGPEPDTVSEANFVPLRLRTLRTRNSAAYKGIHALLMRDGALDFRSGASMDAQVYFEDRVDVHHIFPTSWCNKQPEIPAKLPDCIINKTPLSAASNRAIGGAAPSQYLARIQRDAGISEARMDEILATHVIDAGALRADDFWAFFRAREQTLLERIEKALGKPIAGTAVQPAPAPVPPAEEGAITGAAPRVPEAAQGVLVVEGETDEKYLLIAADAAGRPELLEGIHIVACEGVNGVVRHAVLLKENDPRPLIALFDKDENGKAGRDTLLKRFSFTKPQVLTYADVLDASADGIEAEDLWPPKLLQRFVEEYGEDNVLSEKQRHPQLKEWHYGFNAAGKDIIDEFLRENASEDDAATWVKLLELVRARLGLPIPTPPPPGGARPTPSPPAESNSLADEGEDDDEDEDEDEESWDDDEVPIEESDVGPVEDSAEADGSIESLLSQVRHRIHEIGPGIKEAERKRYIAFSAGKRFAAIVRRRDHLQVFLALGDDFRDEHQMVRRPGDPEKRRNSVWAYAVRLTDASQLDPALDLVRQAHDRVLARGGGEKPWLIDGKRWHLEQRSRRRGRLTVETLMGIIESLSPPPEGPDWSQKLSVAWGDGQRTWLWIVTGAGQARLIFKGSKSSPEELAEKLGFEQFDREADLADKLATGSSVGWTKDRSALQVRVKSPTDLDPRRSEVLRQFLQEAWGQFRRSDEANVLTDTGGEIEPATFVDDEQGYLRWIQQHPDGFILNTYRNPSASYLMLHRATCPHIADSAVQNYTKDYAKVCCERRHPLLTWTQRRFQTEPTRCQTCTP